MSDISSSTICRRACHASVHVCTQLYMTHVSCNCTHVYATVHSCTQLYMYVRSCTYMYASVHTRALSDISLSTTRPREFERGSEKGGGGERDRQRGSEGARERGSEGERERGREGEIARESDTRPSLSDISSCTTCQRILYEKEIKSKLSGNEGYYTNSSILLVKNMLCSKLHCQKGFNSMLY